MSWIQTLDGAAFDLRNGDYRQINPHTIAVASSRSCRFGGHCREFYSVAQHALVVESLVADPRAKLPALLHDAHEVYSGFGDVVSPAKRFFETAGRDIKAQEWRTDGLIASRFGFDPALFEDPAIKHADLKALAAELRDVMGPAPHEWVPLPDPSDVPTIEPWPMEKACAAFLERLRELWGEHCE